MKYYIIFDLPIHEDWSAVIGISELGSFSCGMTTALKPNTSPVLIVPDGLKRKSCHICFSNDTHMRRSTSMRVLIASLLLPKFAITAASTCRKALPRSLLLS